MFTKKKKNQTSSKETEIICARYRKNTEMIIKGKILIVKHKFVFNVKKSRRGDIHNHADNEY